MRQCYRLDAVHEGTSRGDKMLTKKQFESLNQKRKILTKKCK